MTECTTQTPQAFNMRKSRTLLLFMLVLVIGDITHGLGVSGKGQQKVRPAIWIRHPPKMLKIAK